VLSVNKSRWYFPNGGNRATPSIIKVSKLTRHRYISCDRGGRRHRGLSVHGDIDIVPASVPSRWEVNDADTALIAGVPTNLLRTPAEQSDRQPSHVEIVNRFQMRDRQIEHIGWALKTEMETGYPNGDVYLDSLGTALSVHLLNHHSSDSRGTKAIKGHDVLIHTTPPLERGLEVTGPLRLILYVSTNATNTDFTGKLVDVYPDGTAYNVSDGILRQAYGAARTQIELDLGPTSLLFHRGHRIRLEVSSSNFPRFDRNPNTGGDVASETRPIPAQQNVFPPDTK
jgi:hypothetical protein